MSDAVTETAAPKGAIMTIFSLPVIVAALGYFVDIYDLVLFSIVRVPSLKGIGVTGQDLIGKGVLLLNMQMIGMLLGGILWGILGDRKGRLKIMFGSIFIYSAANLANAMVTSIEAYAVLRFIAGVGLAGELGAGITLVSEVLHKSLRGYGTMIVASVGVSGAILANFIAKSYDWRTSFVIGGILGLALLLLRLGVAESGMFKGMENRGVRRGNFLSLFTSRDRFGRFLHSIMIGLPSWFVVGVLITFSPEFAKVLNVQGTVSAGNAVMFCYLGLVFGDFASGMMSQLLQSRRKVVLIFQAITIAAIAVFSLHRGQQRRLLRLLRLSRIRHRLLGHFRHSRSRTVWHQPACHRGHHRPQFCARHDSPYHPAVPASACAARHHGERPLRRVTLHGGGAFLPLAHTGNLPQGSGLF